MRGTFPHAGSGVTAWFQVDQWGPGTRHVQEASRTPGRPGSCMASGWCQETVSPTGLWALLPSGPGDPGRGPQPGPHRLLCTIRGRVQWPVGTQGL